MKRCDDCGCETWEPGDPYEGIGTPVPLGGQRHKPTCPQVPQLSPEAERQLAADLRDMDRARRRAEVESRTIWVGGAS